MDYVWTLYGFFMDSKWLYIDCVQILHGLSKVAQGFNDDAHVLDQGWDQVGRSRELQDDLSNWHKVGTRSAQGQKRPNWAPEAQWRFLGVSGGAPSGICEALRCPPGLLITLSGVGRAVVLWSPAGHLFNFC